MMMHSLARVHYSDARSILPFPLTTSHPLPAVGSWSCGYLRIGLLVRYVHDVSDIFVDALKMANFLKLEGRRGWFASEIAYVVCLATWVYYRLWQLPFTVIPASLRDVDVWYASSSSSSSSSQPDVSGLMPEQWSFSWKGFLTGADRHVTPPWYLPLNCLLLSLQAMHVYWFYLLAMVGYRILTESAREASRQEYEGDSDGEEEEEADGTESPAPLAVRKAHKQRSLSNASATAPRASSVKPSIEATAAPATAAVGTSVSAGDADGAHCHTTPPTPPAPTPLSPAITTTTTRPRNASASSFLPAAALPLPMHRSAIADMSARVRESIVAKSPTH